MMIFMKKYLLIIVGCIIATYSFSQVKTITYFKPADNKESASKRKSVKEYSIIIPVEYENIKN